MKVEHNKNNGTFSLTVLSVAALSAIASVLKEANGRCFGEMDESGVWYAGDGFMCLLSDSERKALREVCTALIG